MIATINAQARREPWVRYRRSGLFAIPSIHYRQTFADCVYRACRARAFDVIAVELPASYQRSGLVEAIRQVAPAVGRVVHATGVPEPRPVPLHEHPDCPDKVIRPVAPGRLFPVTPADSIVMALRCPELLAEHRPGWRSEIALVDAEPRPAQRPLVRAEYRDDYEVTLGGLAEFVARHEETWQRGRNDEIDGLREAHTV
jgi:hypothetical protein